MAATTAGLVPVVKGNGYGFGRLRLAEIAAEFCDTVAVGTVHELAGLPDALTAVVLTPTLQAPATSDPILTVGRPEHLDALDAWVGRVLVKLPTDLRRYGGSSSIDRHRPRARTRGCRGVAPSADRRDRRRPDSSRSHRLITRRRSSATGLAQPPRPRRVPRRFRPDRSYRLRSRNLAVARRQDPRCTSPPMSSTCAPFRRG